MDEEWFSSSLERGAVTVLRSLVVPLIEAREADGRSLRDLAAGTGLSLSVVTGFEQGSSWPRLATLQSVAGAFGFEVRVNDSSDVLDEIVRLLGDWPLGRVASSAGLRRQTLYDLKVPGRPLSMETLLRISGALEERRREARRLGWRRDSVATWSVAGGPQT